MWPYYGILATAVTPVGAVTGDVLTYLLNYGPVGFAAVLFGLGYIVPKKTLDEKAADAKEWRALYESERAAHSATREALATQGERLQVAVESGRVTEALLREARTRAIPAKE